MQVLVCALVVAGGEGDPGAQQGAVGGGQGGDQLRGVAQVAKRQAQQCFGFVGTGQQRRSGPGKGVAGGADGGQGFTVLPAGGPDRGPVEQREVFE